MKKETKTIAEYKAPKCKELRFYPKNILCASFGTTSVKQGNTDWWDDDEDENN